MAIIDDTNALRLPPLHWAETESLKRVPVSHGAPIDEKPGQALRELANSMT